MKQWKFYRSPIEWQTRHGAELLIRLFHAITFDSFRHLNYEWYMTSCDGENNFLPLVNVPHFSKKWKMYFSLIINPRSARCFFNNSWKSLFSSFQLDSHYHRSEEIKRHKIINFHLRFTSMKKASVEEVSLISFNY